MLRDISKLAKDAVSKNPIISKVCLEKILEFPPCYRILGLKAILLLVLLLDYYSAEKQGGKKNLIWPISSSGFKIIFIPLVEIIAIKM